MRKDKKMGMLELVKEQTRWCQEMIGQRGIRLEEQIAGIVSRSTKDYSDDEVNEIASRLSCSAHKAYLVEKLRRELAIGRKYLVSGEEFSDEINMFAVGFQDFIIGIGILKEGDSGYYRYSVCYCDPGDTERGLWNHRFARGALAYRLLASLSDEASGNRVKFIDGESDTNMVRFVLYKMMADALGNTGFVPMFFRKRVSTPGYIEHGMGIGEIYMGRKRRQEQRSKEDGE